LRDPDFTRVRSVTLPEATPIQEAARLQEAGSDITGQSSNHLDTVAQVRSPHRRASGLPRPVGGGAKPRGEGQCSTEE
jgi:hypothetical protein